MKELHNRYGKILVANRGEIAIRILRAASELNLRTIAVYTFEDRYSLHRYKADEAYQIGQNDEALKPYLDIDEIIRISKINNVDAIHPGYGFLSENVDFVRKCNEAGIIFIGPDSDTIEKLGDKVKAKIVAKSIGIPVIQDSENELDSFDIISSEAERIGFPVMVKALAGGGGRGMRVVHKMMDLKKAVKDAKNEAKNAFDDDTIFLEKYIEDPKHVEIQILADNYGNIVHLYERDCSVQRRFQKVVEIAPSPVLRQETKDKLYSYAKQLAKVVNYKNAGTVEFLIDKSENIFFIEVNPRIQVEHTITEEVTGIDIVRSQILISMGYALSHAQIYINSQEDVQCNGYAIQCRITTEDPENDFKPNFGEIIAYRSAAGFGVRLDAGSAYAGSIVSPYFDSMLVKVTSWGRTLKGSALRLHRVIREFRIRGVKTNTGFLLNLLLNPTFYEGRATVNFIKENKDLLIPPKRQDRSTKVLNFIGNVIINGNTDVPFVDENTKLKTPVVPTFDELKPYPNGTKDILNELGPKGVTDYVKNQNKILYTDTTLRDAHQSLLATRFRTIDLVKGAESFAKNHGEDVFSMEVWGGATFDVAMRFLKECPWERLRLIRKAIPNVLLQMLLRSSNAVGYKAYPDNLVEKFVEKSWENGVDVFRIFDSLNWIDSMIPSIKTVKERTEGIAEASICYTGDLGSPSEHKFNLDYYLTLARQMEDAGADILAIKDMAGLLKPQAVEILIPALKKAVDMPIHLHTHDTSSIQSATYMKAVDAGVDIIDVAISSMSGMTSQPNFNSIVSMIKGHERSNKIDVHSLNKFGHYWENVRSIYYPFESELKAGTAEVYDHEIPGGQYSNLKPQARSLGLEDKFETITENYAAVNKLFGNIVKVTPSSKVVGDMAMYLTANNLTVEDVLKDGESLSFPDSVVSLFRGELGLVPGGFPKEIQSIILKGAKPYTKRANEYLQQIDFDIEFASFKEQYPSLTTFEDFLSYKLYPKVFQNFYNHVLSFGKVQIIPSKAFFYGLKVEEEIMVEIEKGKNILVKYLNASQPDNEGNRRVSFLLNGQTRSIKVKDYSIKTDFVKNVKAIKELDIGAPFQGVLTKILVHEGQLIQLNTPLFSIEAMKMESTITSPVEGTVKKIHLKEKAIIEQDDLIIELY